MALVTNSEMDNFNQEGLQPIDSTTMNTDQQIEILNTDDKPKKIIKTNSKQKLNSKASISDDFIGLISTLIVLIIIGSPSAYIYHAEELDDYDNCSNNDDFLINIAVIFNIGKIASLLVMPLSQYSANIISYKSNNKILISFTLYGTIIISIMFCNKITFHIILMCIYGCFLFLGNVFMNNIDTNIIYNPNNSKNKLFRKLLIFCSLTNNIFLIFWSLLSLYISRFDLIQIEHCQDKYILYDIINIWSLMNITLSIIGLWITLNARSKLKYVFKKMIFSCLASCAFNGFVGGYLNKMENPYEQDGALACYKALSIVIIVIFCIGGVWFVLLVP